MVIRKIALSRRTVLRGMGATVALPLLDAMVPALSAMSGTAAKPVLRLGFFHVPNGTYLPNFHPRTPGRDFELTPVLKPLAAVRENFIVMSGLDNREAQSGDEGSGPHLRCATAWLSGVRPKKTE